MADTQTATAVQTDQHAGQRGPAYYGNLAIVAMGFYVRQGNPGELVAAYWYARYAARAVLANLAEQDRILACKGHNERYLKGLSLQRRTELRRTLGRS